MKGVFLGSDFMYRQDGKLVPIEINTNIALDFFNMLEDYEEAFDVKSLAFFVAKKNILKIILEGRLAVEIKKAVERWAGPEFKDVDIEIVASLEDLDKLGDTDSILKIRTSYSDDAIVDVYCRDKIEFLKLNQAEDFGQSFIWKTGDGNLEGNVAAIDNGNHPNFIVKCRYPQYDKNYPQLLRFETEAEVRAWAEENLETDYYISPFLYNESNLVEFPNGNKRLGVYRHIVILVAVDNQLVSVPIGAYTKWCNDVVLENPTLDMYENGVLKEDCRQYYLSKNTVIENNLNGYRDLLAEKDDEILMSDGTWKKVQDLKVGDAVKSLKVEGKDGADIHDHIVDYNESLEEFEAETKFEDAEIVSFRGPVEGYTYYVRFEFEDRVTWNDTADSSYLMLDPEDNSVRFQTLDNIKAGDTILLLDATETDKPTYIQKTVADISEKREFIEGYSLSLEGSHIFLSREAGMPEMFASIEHNVNCTIKGQECPSTKPYCCKCSGDLEYTCYRLDQPDCACA